VSHGQPVVTVLIVLTHILWPQIMRAADSTFRPTRGHRASETLSSGLLCRSVCKITSRRPLLERCSILLDDLRAPDAVAVNDEWRCSADSILMGAAERAGAAGDMITTARLRLVACGPLAASAAAASTNSNRCTWHSGVFLPVHATSRTQIFDIRSDRGRRLKSRAVHVFNFVFFALR